MEPLKILIADDSNFQKLHAKKVITTYFEDIEFDTVDSLHAILPQLSRKLYNILLLDLIFPEGNSSESISIIKKNYPQLYVCVCSGQTDVRTAVNTLNNGADYYLVKDESYSSDLVNAISQLKSRIHKDHQLQTMLSWVFDESDYPMAVMKSSEIGATTIVKDFDKFPEDIGNFDVYLQNISIRILVSLGQGESYHTGFYKLPAGDSNFYTLYNYAFRLLDRHAIDERQREGYLHMLIFAPNAFLEMIPSTEVLDKLMPDFSDFVDDVSEITEEILAQIKGIFFNRIKAYKMDN